MNGVTASSGPAPVAYFSEALPGTTTLRLAAAVTWRGTPARSALHGGGGLLGPLRGLRHRLWLRLGPLGADVSVAGHPLFGGDARAARALSSAAASPGEPLAYYDAGSRVLRVLGRVVAAPPPGQTIVVLIDATGQHATVPRLVLRVVPTPAVAVPRFEIAAPFGAAANHYMVVGEHPAWTAALRADPVVRDFVDGREVP